MVSSRNEAIEIGLRLLSKVCEDNASREGVMQGIDGEKAHALDVLDWAQRLSSGPVSAALGLAALFHDVDRMVTPNVGGGFKGERSGSDYLEHKKRHAQRSARYAAALLTSAGMVPGVIERTRFLIEHSDDAGFELESLNDSELDILASSDTFAFFSSIAPALYRAEGEARLRDKVSFMVDKMANGARILLWETPLPDQVFGRVKNDIIRDYYLEHNPRERQYLFCPTCASPLSSRSIEGRLLRACSDCDFVFWNNPKPVASAIVECEHKVLMARRASRPLKDYWCLPGGYVDYGEEPHAAAIREMKEETGFVIQIERLVGVYLIDNDPRGVNIDSIYAGRLVAGAPRPNEEVSELAYFGAEELPELVAYKHREAIGDWRRQRQQIGLTG